MVNLVPAEISDLSPVSEIVIFNALNALSTKNDWIVLHSLKQKTVIQGVEAETDFLVFIPKKGIVVVEAKGATRVTAQGSNWVLDGVAPKQKHKNPFDQIDNATRNIQARLKKLGYETKSIPFARLTWLTKISPFNANVAEGTGFHHWEIAYQEDLSKVDELLLKVVNSEIANKQANPTVNYNHKNFSEELAKSMANALIGQIEAASTPLNLAFERKGLVSKATDEQSQWLKLIERNNIVYFEGEAGTGKTELLMRSAKNLAASRKVLFVCYNLLLAEELEKMIGQHPNIDVMDMNTLLLRITGGKKPKNANNTWFDVDLPAQALEAVEKNRNLAQYEAICIDEFQDIATRPDAFKTFLKLGNSKFRPVKILMAGDDEQQIMTSGAPVASFKLAQTELPNVVHILLETNCRQAPSLSKKIHQLLGWRWDHLNHRLPKSTESNLEVIETTPERQTKDLYKVLTRLLKDVRPEDIRVLSPFGENSSALAQLFKDSDTHSSELRNLKKLLKHKSTTGLIRWRSIGKYKGLENDAIVITDITKDSKTKLESIGKLMSNQLYVGMTRARFQVVLLVSDGLYPATHEVDGSPKK